VAERRGISATLLLIPKKSGREKQYKRHFAAVSEEKWQREGVYPPLCCRFRRKVAERRGIPATLLLIPKKSGREKQNTRHFASVSDQKWHSYF